MAEGKEENPSEPEKPKPDREDEKDGSDDTEDTLRTDSVGNSQPDGVKESPGKERDLSKVPSRIIERKTVQVFSLRMLLVEERYEQIIMHNPTRSPNGGISELMDIRRW